MPFSFSTEDLDLLHLPVVHLNGTGKQNLSEEYTNALLKVADAIKAFNKTTFHQRDFYPIDPNSTKYYEAQKLRWKMQMMLRIIADYLQAHVESFKQGESADWIIEALKKDLKRYQ